MALSWAACDARTGKIIASLPNFTPQGQIAATIGAYNTLTGSLPFPPEVVREAQAPGSVTWDDATATGDAPLGLLAGWRRATRPGATVLVASDELSNPIWGGLVLQRNTDLSAAGTVSLVTLEAYFARRYISTGVSFTAQGQNDIISTLIDDFIADGTLPGIPLTVVASGANTARDRVYLSGDDKTILSALQDLSGVSGGPEWTVKWQRLHSPERYCPVLYVADRLGSDVQPGRRPVANFTAPGCVIDATLTEDYSDGKGANSVMAISSPADDGSARPQATAVVTDYEGRPTFEYRWTPSTSISETETLTEHADAALALLKNGTAGLAVTARISAAPVLEQDWSIGDTVGVSLRAPAWIDGLLASQTFRAVGWSRDDTTITPLFAAPDVAGA